jgi:hypothetical protein
MIYYLRFGNINGTLLMGQKNVQVELKSGRIRNELASRIRICNSQYISANPDPKEVFTDQQQRLH